MADGQEGYNATPAVLMELRDERQVVEDGRQFLDEKRLLLAARALDELRGYEKLRKEFSALEQQAAAALRDAVARHGEGGLALHPAAAVQLEIDFVVRPFLGVRLEESQPRLTAAQQAAVLDPSAEVRRAEALFRELILRAGALAVRAANLERLLEEYRRTERRTRALEDVLLPELEGAIHDVSSRIEELEQEEAVRVRLRR